MLVSSTFLWWPVKAIISTAIILAVDRQFQLLTDMYNCTSTILTVEKCNCASADKKREFRESCFCVFGSISAICNMAHLYDKC